MKRYSIMIIIVLTGIIMALADEIHLTNGTILRGGVVRITDETIWYQPEQDEKSISRDSVKNIILNSSKDKTLDLIISGDNTGSKTGMNGESSGNKYSDRHRIISGIVVQYGLWGPNWRENDVPLEGGFYSTNPGVHFGGMAALRIGSGWWLSGRFIYGRYTFFLNPGIIINNSPSIPQEDNIVETYDADVILRFCLTDRFNLFFGIQYLGYFMQLNAIILITEGYYALYGVKDDDHINRAGPVLGIEYTLPLFWVISLRGKLSGGWLYGSIQGAHCIGLAGAILGEGTLGLQVDIPPLDVTVNFDTYMRYLYFHAFESSMDIGYKHDVMLGLRFSAQYFY